MVPDAPSPFVEIPHADWLCANTLAFAIHDRFKVSPQSVLDRFTTAVSDAGGGRFAVEKCHSKKTVTADGWRADRIHLLPVNSAFEPIEIEPEEAADLMIVAELLETMGAPDVKH